MSDTVIQVDNLWKEYRLGVINHHTLTRDLQSWWAKVRGKEDPNTPIGSDTFQTEDRFWALRDVSFEVKQGDILGIIGCNGAGKSTLLKILSQVTAPSKGEVRFKGKIASLLEVGTGFHPELTGRENIFLNGAILGMSKADIRKRLDEIVAFAEIEYFMDTPVKRYSSGMYVRLAFAVAAHLEPDILIIDEVLAVGDAQFQKKCLGKMEDVSAKEGRTILFVSHQMDMIRSLCSRGILLNSGRVFAEGGTEKVIDDYVQSFSLQKGTTTFEEKEDPALQLQILMGRVMNEKGETQETFDVFDRIIFELEYRVYSEMTNVVVNFELKRNNTTLFLSFDTDMELSKFGTRAAGRYRCRIELPCPLLKSGRYSITTNTGIANTCTYQRLEDVLMFDVELLSQPSSLLSYADKRPGVIAVPIYWETEKVREF